MIKCEDEHPYCKPPLAQEEEQLASSTDMQQQPVIMEWSENFQDLSLFCNFGTKMAADNKNMMLRSGEQLDTPIITVNDEFDFGQRGSSRVSQQQHQLLLADASLDDTDPWADLQQQQQQQQPPSNNTPLPTTAAANNVKQWESVTDWLCSSPSVDYEPSSTVANSTFDENFEDSTKLHQDFLVGDPTLEMEHNEKELQCPESTNLQEDFNPVLNKEQTIDIVELLKSANSQGEPLKSTNKLQQYVIAGKTAPVTDKTNRMQYSFAGKVVDSSERTQYSAETKVADASNSSRMQYSLVGNKVADINNSSTLHYSGSRNRVVTVPNISTEYKADELAVIPSPLVVESRKTIVASAPKLAPPSYGEKKEDNYERREPLSTIKEEDITTDESSSFQLARNSKNLPRKKITLTRKRRRTNYENYESENSSDPYIDNEDEDETFHLPPKTNKYIQSNKSKRQRLSTKTISIVSASPSKRKVSSSGIDSDQESIISQDRYRELRDRNNEASKRSRMNRKSREMEMKEKADEMEQRNSYLKARAKRLDELVQTFREAIFKLVPKRS
ncbi:hypothetical protein LSTR_LSTR008652 [Laodelphax striatellus]|uniref:BZIP domain-containing protein n=1 Tax=Laodelphax striatellus TaxID=195883 RepID=A0A482WM55_LAOST|nr:hypothetical protein LSTR_LSTR008652 [Laodelphax striatellus]